MIHLFIDTSLWLDLAKRRDGQRWIVPLRVFHFQSRLRLLVPQLVVDEFERNRPRAEAAVTAAVAERFRLLRKDLHDWAGAGRQEWLAEMAYHVPLVSSSSLQNFAEIADLLRSGARLEVTGAEHRRVVERGLSKSAPLHRNKNSVADALLIELYHSQLAAVTDDSDLLGFATCNFEDFSEPNGDRRRPHSDLAPLFNPAASRYIYDVDGLENALADWFGADFHEIADEADTLHEEPRTLVEILGAEKEYFDKIWYVRSSILDEKIERGESKPIGRDLEDQRNAARGAIEDRYGRENLGPWDDWTWGFVHGKLSALRWVLGSEWDFLDT
ncbi:PIN domain-containing protein [Pseudofrankia sp. BMG5.36]|uniref:PIN domain-containing protein n=1 Tax=Pseudofrankia sp. BMG5.36 TaxID=1834512 RepID=UPI0008D97631|nr:PIN domain-containing protein [Pseudofrankia sp. BMG5.36]OHV56558.1 hypothetical protein BCD48_43925 [Pseudofrankia sp. BMG5.36]